MLDNMGVLTTVDGGQLERYVVYYLRWRQCEAFIAQMGMTYAIKSDDPTYFIAKPPKADGTAPPGATPPAVIGFAEYPQVKESHRLDAALKQIEAQFGLTPSARTRLQAAPPATEPNPQGKSRFFAG
jgi:P27 family predicted phage terminase small subunit